MDDRKEPTNVRETVLDSSISDQPSKSDKLGFEPYVTAIADFLTHPNTKGPLTLSVEGEWGTGKSSFMLQLAELLEQKERTVRFNAWRHDKEDALWAAFALKFVRDLSEKMSWWGRMVAKFKLRWHRYDWEEGWFNFALFLLCSVIFVIVTAQLIRYFRIEGFHKIAELATREDGKSFAKILGLTGGAGYLVLGFYLVKKLKDFFVNPLHIDLKRYLDTPNYKGHAAFIEDFHRDFSRIVETYAGKNKKVFVLIDDLDRCEVPKAADLMQALNLMISDSPQLIFIIGMDREKIAAGLAVKYEKLLPYLSPSASASSSPAQPSFDAICGLEYGYTFIEKFIQLPFRVPQPSPANVQRFLTSLNDEAQIDYNKEIPLSAQRPDLVDIVSDKDSPTVNNIVLTVAPALDYNPRRIKQFINTFRLQTHIASRTGLFAEPDPESKYAPLTLERLGKFVAIMLRWPLLAADLDRDHTLLSDLQEVAWKLQSEADSRWASKKKLIRLLREGFEVDSDGEVKPVSLGKDDERRLRYALTDMDIDKLLQVSPLTKPKRKDISDSKSTFTEEYQSADTDRFAGYEQVQKMTSGDYEVKSRPSKKYKK
jgi:hypothetical protein